MTGLGSRMDNGRWSDFPQEPQDGRTISNVRLVMMKRRMAIPEPLQVPAGVALRTKKIRAHIIVNPMHNPSVGGKCGYDFRAYQAG